LGDSKLIEAEIAECQYNFDNPLEQSENLELNVLLSQSILSLTLPMTRSCSHFCALHSKRLINFGKNDQNI